MKTWKTVSGVLSLFISAFVIFQSFFAGLLNILTSNGQSSGTAGLIVAGMLASAGIISLVTREGSRGGDIAMAVLYGVGGVVGLVLAGNYADLRIWALWGLLCMVVAMVDIGIHELTGAEEEDAERVRSQPAPARPAHATLEEVLTEQDPQKRSAAIDALPEWEAKNYLKRVLNTFLSRDGEDEETTGLVRVLIVVLAIVGLALVAVIAVGIFTSLGIGFGAPATPPPAATQGAQESEAIRESGPVQDSPEPSQDDRPAPVSIPGSGNLGDYYVEIKGAYLLDDYQGNPAVVVTYAWTNNSQETTNAMAQLLEQTFQNGVELDRATISSSQRYEAGTSLRDVRPGAQAEVQCAFRLPNTTSPIEFEVSEFLSQSNTVVYATFDLTALAAEE